MKTSILCLLLAIQLSALSQQSTKTLSKFEIKQIQMNCEFVKQITSGKTTNYIVYCGFQNFKYSHITDLGSIGIHKQPELDSLIAHAEVCMGYMDEKEQNICYNRKKYKLCVHDFSKLLYLQDRHEKYVRLTKKQAIKWVDWLKTIEIPVH